MQTSQHLILRSGIIAALLTCVYLMIPLANPVFKDDYSTAVLDENGELLRVFLNSEEQWCFPDDPSLKRSAKLETAVLEYEDVHFYRHPGVNPLRVMMAIWQNTTSDRIVSGASTISMQVARMSGRRPRTYTSKLIEVLVALKLEFRYSKDDILRLYLNHAPYGGNIIGFQAAALRYFSKIPQQLTWSEAALLAVLPNAPGLMSPDVNPDQLRNKRDGLLRKLRYQGHFDDESLELALIEPLPEGSIPFRTLAAHAARRLKFRHAPEGGILRSTLHKKIQRMAEAETRYHQNDLMRQGIMNSAAIIVDTRSGAIRAYVGSQDFFDLENKGQVDGIMAPRSSASTLKPLLYGAAIDDGIILPTTQLRDVPSYYGSFSPSNADEQFDGVVRAEEALTRSLNVPAVRLLYTYGVHPFYLLLKSAGISTLFRQAQEYGLPLILGGAEVNLLELAGLFRSFSDGRYQPLHILANTELPEKEPILSPMASWLTLEMMREVKRPGAEYYWDRFENQWPLAWKTGTSYGQRDGWAVGVSPEWTIGVWVGNFDGKGNSNLGGAKSAGPLLFKLFSKLEKNPDFAWFDKPEKFKPVDICRETGFLATSDCPNPEVHEAPEGMKPLRLCPFHQRVFLSGDKEKQVCSLCWEGENHVMESELIYPPDIVQHLRERGHITYSLPSHKRTCPARQEALAVQIVYPKANARLILPVDFGGELQKLTLRAAHRESDRRLYWYLDERYLGETRKRHDQAVEVPSGWHTLEVVDEIGQRDQLRFYVGSR